MKKTVLALGADIKNRFLFARGNKIVLGPDIGDLSHVDNFEFFKKQTQQIIKNNKPNIIACDLHPEYFSTKFAREFDYQFSTVNCQLIQHHHAHIASVMQEHKLTGPVIGVSFDGTGYGEDANSWGGEFLLVDRNGFKRLAHLKYRMMPGGDKVVHEPWRMVLSILGKKAFPLLNGVKKKDKELMLAMLAKNINSPLTSSAGRLFDAAAALLGICVKALYEAEGPIKLEAMCDEKIDARYGFKISKENGYFIIDADGLFLGMFNDLRKGRDKCLIATKFHNSMTEIIIETVKRLSKSFGIKDIALSGGVFQNKFLKTRVIQKLCNSGFSVFTNLRVPVNDLNISLGQYYVSGHSGKN